MSTKAGATVWAVIIGIDHYPSDRCLGGAVKDANAMRDYLQDISPHTETTILTATCPSDTRSRQPIEEPGLWPTWDNVVAGLRRIIMKANKGDFVYFHYSGHGTKVPRPERDGKSGEEELAFVLFEDDEIGSRYLEGRFMASALRKMVDMGLVVTLVLDCCFSGSVARYGDSPRLAIRYTEYSRDVSVASAQKYEASIPEDTFRNSRVAKDWLVDPDGYTILAACGPYETASEVKINTEGRRGALSFYLLDTLRELGKNGTEISHHALHQRLATTFHALWPQQTPMRYGNSNRSFFGQLVASLDNRCISIFKTKDGGLRLRAGHAHGIYEGDEFAVYPFGTTNFNGWSLNRTLKATRVRPLESDLVEVNRKSIGSQIETGWKAKLSTCVSARKIGVRLMSKIRSQDEWRKRAEHLRFISLFSEEDDGACLFTVTINDQDKYVLNALYNKYVDLPTIPVDSHKAITTVLDVLQHLATFKFFEGIQNRQSVTAFQKTFAVSPHSDPSASGVFEVQHEGTWGLTINNTHDKSLYLSVFNFRPSWEIDNMLTSSGGDGYLVIPPKQDGQNGKKKINLIMEIPDDLRSRGQTQCEDIIKIFITSKPTSFPSMVLPPLDWDKTWRSGEIRDADKLQEFLDDLATQYRGSNEGDEDGWATRNFILQTTLK